jgi:hypothetical protein
VRAGRKASESIAERVRFVAAPSYEAVASLHVIVAPAHHPRQAGWVRRCRSLPDELRRAIRASAPRWRAGLPEQIVNRIRPARRGGRSAARPLLGRGVRRRVGGSVPRSKPRGIGGAAIWSAGWCPRSSRGGSFARAR